MNVRQTITNVLGVDVSKVDEDALLVDIGLSSLDIVALLVRIETELGGSIPFERLAELSTLGSFEVLVSDLQLPSNTGLTTALGTPPHGVDEREQESS